MATEVQNIFITKKKKLQCNRCGKPVPYGEKFVAESEDSKGACFDCAPFTNYVLLPPGNAALTRRSKKHSSLCGVLYRWNNRRRRYEREGQYVEALAISKAQAECENDQEKRTLKNKKVAEIRAVKDKEYIHAFTLAIRAHFPNCPPKREVEIATHACEKYSGRVGRSANAKQFDTKMIELAVVAHIRHTKTNYDNQFGKGKRKKEIRADLSYTIRKILAGWKSHSVS